MTGIEQLLTLARTYSAALDVSSTTVSWRVFGDSKKLDALEGGADIQTRRLESALAWFSQHWPKRVDWPVDIPRPMSPAEPANTDSSTEPAA